MQKKIEGICRLCGDYKKLSFEHIPPKSAFNDQQIVFKTMQDLLRGRSHSKFRKGIGNYSLCQSCNNLTGSWYGEAFVDWTRQGLVWFDKLGDKSLLSLPYYIKPLQVIKQTLVMALAMTSARTLNYHQDLRHFVMNKKQQYLPPKYQVYTYFNVDGSPRFVSDIAVIKLDSGSANYVEAEISLPPFGYCISKTVKNLKSLAKHQGLYEISWFSKYRYNDWSPVHLRIPAQETYEPLPLDYRTKEEIQSHNSYSRSNIQK